MPIRESNGRSSFFADKRGVEPKRPEHPDEDTLELYALHRLDRQPEREVEQHVFSCPRCQRLVMRLARQAQLIRAALALYFEKLNV